MRKMFKMIWENILFFLDMLFMIVTLVASVFIPYLVYGLYAGYVFLILDVCLLVEDKSCRRFQNAALLLGVFTALIGHAQSSAVMLYIMQPIVWITWLHFFIAYLKIMEKNKK